MIAAASAGPVGIGSDFERWERGFHPDWTYWRLGADAVRPRQEHMDRVRGVVASGTRVTAYVLTPVDVIVRGDVALLRYNAEETLQAADGSERVVRYSSVAMYVNEGGRWQALASSLFYPDR